MSTLTSFPIFVYYYGFTFPPETETVALNARPVYDSAGRAVKYVVYEITIKTRVTGGTPSLPATSCDDIVAALRRILTTPGREFHYEGVGFGQLSVNVPAAGPAPGGLPTVAKDVVWGPKPRVLSYKPLGQITAELVWTVEVAIPECGTASYAFATMEFNFRLNFDIDKSGYTRRTYSGFVRIPQTRNPEGGNALSDQADRMRETINPPPVPGFRRIPGRFTDSEDKCRVDFEIFDEEMPTNVPPVGVVEVSASTTVVTGDSLAGKNWAATYNATYEMARDVPRSGAFKCFLDLLKDRVGNVGVGGKKAMTLPRALSISEGEIYGRKAATFIAVYQMISSNTDIVLNAGLWRPVPGTDWYKWSASMANTAFHPRGNAKMQVGNDVEAIVDLCNGMGYNINASGPPPEPAPTGPYGLQTDYPAPGTSYVSYQAKISADYADETIELKILPTSPIGPDDPDEPIDPLPPFDYGISTGGGVGIGDVASGSGKSTSFSPAPGSPQTGSLDRITVNHADAPVVQRRAHPSRYVFLQGYAVRAGYPVDIPAMISADGKGVTRANRTDAGEGVQHWLMDSWFGVPVYAATWNLRYLVAGQITAADIPPHPYI